VLVAAGREATYAEMAEHLNALAEGGGDEHMTALVECPQPLATVLGRHSGDAGPLVEAMTRRYYRIRPLEASAVINRFARMSVGLGLEMVQLRLRIGDEDRVLRMFNPAGRGVTVELGGPPTRPLQPLDEGAQRIISARRRGLVHPAEIVKLLDGDFEEHDLVDGELVPVDRPSATNTASIVVGLIRNATERHPEGMLRVALLGDPTRGLGSRTWTGSRRRCGASCASPRRAARSTSSCPASTSAPSRTGTPRRRC